MVPTIAGRGPRREPRENLRHRRNKPIPSRRAAGKKARVKALLSSTCRTGCLLAATALLGGACVGHQHTVGLGPTGTGVAQQRQYYALFGFWKINEVDSQRLAADLTSYSVESQFSFVDLLLQPLLLPFTMTSRTVTVRT